MPTTLEYHRTQREMRNTSSNCQGAEWMQTHSTSMLDVQYPQTPKRTEPLAPELKRDELVTADS